MNELVKEYLNILFWYIVPCFGAGLIVLFIRFVIKPKDFIYRKILHICAVLTVFSFILPAHTWWISILDVLTILILINITLLIIYKTPLYKLLFVDKEKYEIFKMINIYYVVLMTIIAIFFGFRGELHKYLVIIAILCWGFGDAGAALIGIYFGKHKLGFRFVDQNKTIEGSVTMFMICFFVCLITLLIFYNYPVWVFIVEPLVVASFLTITEAISKKGLDTLFCPLMATVILLAFSFVL